MSLVKSFSFFFKKRAFVCSFASMDPFVPSGGVGFYDDDDDDDNDASKNDEK